MEQIERFKEYGYMRDRESRLREVSNGRNDSLAMEAANQIKHLKDALSEMVSIVKIHSETTGNNFAWAEIEEARKALGVSD